MWWANVEIPLGRCLQRASIVFESFSIFPLCSMNYGVVLDRGENPGKCIFLYGFNRICLVCSLCSIEMQTRKEILPRLTNKNICLADRIHFGKTNIHSKVNSRRYKVQNTGKIPQRISLNIVSVDFLNFNIIYSSVNLREENFLIPSVKLFIYSEMVFQLSILMSF